MIKKMRLMFCSIEMTVTAEKFLESSFRVLSAVISEKVVLRLIFDKSRAYYVIR
jgi:hypothetical protein